MICREREKGAAAGKDRLACKPNKGTGPGLTGAGRGRGAITAHARCLSSVGRTPKTKREATKSKAMIFVGASKEAKRCLPGGYCLPTDWLRERDGLRHRRLIALPSVLATVLKAYPHLYLPSLPLPQATTTKTNHTPPPPPPAGFHRPDMTRSRSAARTTGSSGGDDAVERPSTSTPPFPRCAPYSYSSSSLPCPHASMYTSCF